MTSQPKELHIQVISDTICPYCFLGKKKVEAAVAQLPIDVKVSYDWRAFELDETLPEKSVNKLERYASKFGRDRLAPMLEAMKARGREYGIEFSYGGLIGNTIDSHRLVQFSKQPSQGNGVHTDALINTLFNAYFEREQDIANIDTLVDIAVKAGLPASADEVRAFLNSADLRDKVLEEVVDAREAHITGVPHFIINGKYAVSGAQEPETFLSVFKKLGYQPATAAGVNANAVPTTCTKDTC